MTNLKYLFGFLMLTALFACEPEIDDKIDIGTPPSPSFEIIQGSTPNEFILNNTTEGAFITQWNLGSAGTAEGQSATVNFPFKGSYDITMTTFTKGGSASIAQSLTVTQDDPNSCFGNFELLTGCDEKVWKLAPEANAMHIGPNLTETWWGNSVDEVTARECHFDDQYIFRSNGAFEYDNQGAFWADTDGNGNIWPADLGLSEGCNDAASWPEKYKAWDSGIHKFSVTENSLTVTGNGAWIGLYKAGTAGEVTEPQSSITYSIAEISAERMVIFADYGGSAWRFTLVSE